MQVNYPSARIRAPSEKFIEIGGERYDIYEQEKYYLIVYSKKGTRDGELAWIPIYELMMHKQLFWFMKGAFE